MKAETGIHNIYVPFSRSDYQLNNVLSTEERDALSTGHKRTSALSQQGSLSSLLRPLQDIADRSGTSDRLVRIIIPAVLAEIHRTGEPCWLWGSEKWLTLCQQHRSGRPLIAAFVFHLGPFPSPFSLPHHGAPSLYASAIYGREFFTQELNRLTDSLVSLGYKRRNQKNQLSALLGILMMMNSNPQLESFTTDLLWRAQKYHDRGDRKDSGQSFACACRNEHHQKPRAYAQLPGVARKTDRRHRTGLGSMVPAVEGNLSTSSPIQREPVQFYPPLRPVARPGASGNTRAIRLDNGDLRKLHCSSRKNEGR
ncbi:hypothetical protein ABEH08_23375 [Pantoea agglomerans]|uniref:hypothetical protein n=1 Tax=Enterobacter agglomerans TaxID=549 RepID=UPI001F5B442F|nr:hypothetical protein [Pantoea agglomerans]